MSRLGDDVETAEVDRTKIGVVRTLVSRTERHVLRLDENVLVQLLNNSGVVVPRNAQIYVRVPGGGDWSNTNLEVDERCPVFVLWEINTTEGSLSGSED